MVIPSYHEKDYLKKKILFYQAEMALISNVLETGPDRQVRLIVPSTCQKIGHVKSKNRFCIESDEN